MMRLDQLRFGLTVAAILLTWSILIWQHFNGGVSAHYLLHDPDLPRISNWWNGLLLPALAWGLLTLSKRRIKRHSAADRTVVVGLLAGLAVGASMAITFSLGQESITSTVFFSLIPLALFLPVYRPECLLGFVLGMCFAFGAVLPTIFGAGMAAVTFLVHRLIGQPLKKLLRGSNPQE